MNILFAAIMPRRQLTIIPGARATCLPLPRVNPTNNNNDNDNDNNNNNNNNIAKHDAIASCNSSGYTTYEDKRKSISNSSTSFNDQTLTQVAQTVAAIRNTMGGTIGFGPTQCSKPITFAGYTEGQPGGMRMPIRNKF